MPRIRSTITLVLPGLLVCGCAWSPWWARMPASASLSTPAPAASSASAAPSATPSQPDPQAVQEVMAELRQLGAKDPAAQDQLMEQLRQSDPSLWPLVVAQFRATAAYRRRAIEQSKATGSVEAVGRTERLPLVNDLAVAPTEPPREMYPRTSNPSLNVKPSVNQPASQVVQASYTEPCTAPAPADWRQRLAGTIETLEAEVASHPSAAAEAKPTLVAAIGKLSESAPLLVCNMAFCTEVQSYGCAKRFEKYEFQPNQEVLLYAEVENFASEPTPKGYHTALRSSYRIFDALGQRVAEQTFATTEEHCQNLRRDFFIGYHLRLPKDVRPGKHTLRLSIEDLKSRKVGTASIEFEVKEEKEPRMNTDKHR